MDNNNNKEVHSVLSDDEEEEEFDEMALIDQKKRKNENREEEEDEDIVKENLKLEEEMKQEMIELQNQSSSNFKSENEMNNNQIRRATPSSIKKQKIETSLTVTEREKNLQILLARASQYTEFLSSRMLATIAPAATSKSKNKKDAGAITPVAHELGQPETMTGGIMKEYQLVGFRWLVGLWENGLHGILADEMGLGKTVQTISVLAHLRENNVRGPYLIVVPLSTLSNWIREFKKWVPTFPTLKFHGTKEERVALAKQFLDPVEKARKSGSLTASFPVVITTYEVACRDRSLLGKYEWQYLAVDEGHRLKNMNCLLIRELNWIMKKSPTVSKILLTGTPLQNNLKELWSLLHFLLPTIFDDVQFFQSVFALDDAVSSSSSSNSAEDSQLTSTVNKLHAILSPFMMRRLKSDVELNIPEKVEVLIYAKFAPDQRAMYDSIINGELKSYLQTVDGPKKTLNFLVMQLRKCANHPLLHMDDHDAALEHSHHTNESIVESSGKFKILDELLKELYKRKHKVLLFTQFTSVLDLLEDYISIRPNFSNYCRLDGNTKQEQRQELMDKFNSDPSCFLFMLSTRAGGVGINLTAADTVILFDSDWNPHQDSQAQDRCHRIGQTKGVIVYRLLCVNSIEMRMMERANSKRKLERVVCAKQATHANVGKKKDLMIEELRDLLEDDVKAATSNTSAAVDTKFLRSTLMDRDLLFKSVSQPNTPGTIPAIGDGYEIVLRKATSLVGSI